MKWLRMYGVGLTLGMVLTGCKTGAMPQQYVTQNTNGQEVLTGACLPGQTAAACESMRPVTITNNPADEEFWQFEARVKVRAVVGIPYGRMPKDYNVIGTTERCETVRAKVTDPTEPCKGPFYFHTEGSASQRHLTEPDRAPGLVVSTTRENLLSAARAFTAGFARNNNVPIDKLSDADLRCHQVAHPQRVGRLAVLPRWQQ